MHSTEKLFQAIHTGIKVIVHIKKCLEIGKLDKQYEAKNMFILVIDFQGRN